MWSCSRYPDCRGAINIAPDPAVAEEGSGPVRAGVPGGYAQHRWESERERNRLKKRAALPLFVALGVVLMATEAFATSGFGPWVTLAAVSITGFAALLAILRLPFDSLFWLKGAEGERKTAAYLEPLLAEGFVVINDRLIPGLRGNLDHLAIGPTGIFAIETKNWTGRIQVIGGRLFVNDHDRSWVLDQVYREAIAVQIALADELNANRLTVTPVIAIHGTGVPRFNATVAGVTLVAGKALAAHLRDRPALLGAEAVPRIARAADRAFREPPPWEELNA